jgi:hypothetical protein
MLESSVAPVTCLDRLRAVRKAAAVAPEAGEFRERFDMIERARADSSYPYTDKLPQAIACVPALSPQTARPASNCSQPADALLHNPDEAADAENDFRQCLRGRGPRR